MLETTLKNWKNVAGLLSGYWKLKNNLILKLHLIEFYFCKFIPTNESIFAWFLRWWWWCLSCWIDMVWTLDGRLNLVDKIISDANLNVNINAENYFKHKGNNVKRGPGTLRVRVRKNGLSEKGPAGLGYLGSPEGC